MKKIALCSLVLCGMIYGNVSFAAATCRKTPSGEVVCNYINTGGGEESQLCFKSEQESATNPDPEVWEDWSAGLWRWAKKVGQDCTNGKPGAKTAKCIDNHLVRGEKLPLSRSCAAYECLSDYLLYTTNKRKEIDVIGKNQKVGSQGLCRKKADLEKMCDMGCGCAANEKCVLNPVKVRNHNKDVDAFIGEELCICVSNGNGGNGGSGDSSPDTEECKECVYTLKVDLMCANGTTFKKNTQIKITKAEAERLRWEKAKNKLETATPGALIDDLLKEIDGYKELINKICSTGNNAGGMVVVIDNSAEINAAKNKISSFFNSAESNASVWKDTEGKFNTARLASDLTAGVVLGTVGGVVSGVVIKKKQVEKGFEALHCTVGGQPIADWGDTFNVGLR